MIDTLAYPRAALLALSIGFVAYNVLALVKGAMRAAHGAERVEREISFYYLSEELENTHRGLDIAVPRETWERFRQMSPRQLARELVRLAHPIMFNTNLADQVLLVDGGPCARTRRTFEQAGLQRFKHFDLSVLGFPKGNSPASAENIKTVVAKALGVLRKSGR